MPRTNLRDQFTAEQRNKWKPKIVQRNTFRFTVDGCTVTRLHATDIVKELGAGRYELNSGGWKTPTTKDRMNGALRGYNIYQKAGAWYVEKGDYGYSGGVPFFDGMIVPDAFDKPAKAEAAEKRELKLHAQIRKFVAKCDKLSELPAPCSGDCFYCQMVVSDGKDKGKSLGDATGNAEHIHSHLAEGYLHGSLIVNALKWAGYRDPGFIWHHENRTIAEGRKPTMIKRALRRYLNRQCGLAS